MKQKQILGGLAALFALFGFACLSGTASSEQDLFEANVQTVQADDGVTCVRAPESKCTAPLTDETSITFIGFKVVDPTKEEEGGPE